MYATYRLGAGEITDTFLKGLQSAYQDKEVEITVQEIEDETAYLLQTPANREHLQRGIEAVQSGSPLHAITIEEMEAMAQ